MKEYPFTLELAVRDYECDMNEHVNHAVYLNYLEHCRHQYLKSLGLGFTDFVKRGINLIIIRAEIDYKRSLLSGDRFMVGLIMDRISPLRFRFRQDIYSLPEKKLVVRASMIGTALNEKGRPELPAEIKLALDQR